jgi:hypothetical protein
VSDDQRRVLYQGYIVFDGTRMETVKAKFLEKNFALISAWRKVGEEEGDEVQVNASNMEGLKADIKILGYSSLPVSGFGKAVQRKYWALAESQRAKIPQQELCHEVPFFLVVDPHTQKTNDFQLTRFSGDMDNLGIKYDQAFVVQWGGTNPILPEWSVTILDKVQEGLRRACKNFPQMEIDYDKI